MDKKAFFTHYVTAKPNWVTLYEGEEIVISSATTKTVVNQALPTQPYQVEITYRAYAIQSQSIGYYGTVIETIDNEDSTKTTTQDFTNPANAKYKVLSVSGKNAAGTSSSSAYLYTDPINNKVTLEGAGSLGSAYFPTLRISKIRYRLLR
ncbi:MAG: hypothetical protein IKB64_08605 [Paludibacteraceae bacterium]|nr:hypothetical protein [Paludibacteraceae bacterium]